ncbi:MAG TPA: alpha/beta fold hydrolase [Solirubrobacteraceae bacterium]|nr:alpha/beta fold hydrolase [Solirubrobacteraceae bacterium]
MDEGDPAHPPVVFWHGEPTWSYLWRKVIPPVRDAGFRCLAPDLPGFGRSPKPRDVGWFTYDRLTEAAVGFAERHDLRDATFVVHDWGGAIGLRAAMELGDRVTRLVLMNTGLFTGRQRMTDAWQAFRDFVERTEDLPVGMLVRGGCRRDPGDEVIAQYDAPFASAADKAGPRALPLLIPTSPDAPGAAAGRRTLEWLRSWPGPLLMLWGADDPILPLSTGERFAAAIGRPPPEPVPDAAHFLQEDAGEEVGRRIATWLASA